jgi:hypothetical protein
MGRKGFKMTIEERIKNDPTKFQELLKETTPAVQEALSELSGKFDSIFGNVIKQYAESEQLEVNMAEIPNYKTLNTLITKNIDEIVKEYIKDKRNDIL